MLILCQNNNNMFYILLRFPAFFHYYVMLFPYVAKICSFEMVLLTFLMPIVYNLIKNRSFDQF